MTNADARQSVDSENRLSALTIYQAATSHWTHAEQIRWTLLYNYLMASTILLLAWSTLFANHRANPGATLLLAVISLAGAIISVVWILLGIRATGFVAAYHKLGLSLEGPESDTERTPFVGPFTVAERHRQNLTSMKWRSQAGLIKFVRSGLVVSVVPGIFALLYICLFVMSIW